ncbi:MAG TPA: GIY-YIG nuclease family protein [Solirubrobacteraceae bacterium]|nr:GIY-YIG nuclease family protein [Solirubrobacteraceae bacterium]
MPRQERVRPALAIRHIDPEDAPVLEALSYWRQRLDGPLFVYFVQGAPGGPVKIGRARDPVDRVAGLQCGNPDALLIRALLLASDDAEQRLHTRWAHANVLGEWFGGGDEDTIITLAREASAWQIEEHKARIFPVHHIADHGCARVTPPRPGWRSA